MPPRKKVTLPDHVRAAALAEVKLAHQRYLEADPDFKIRIYLATEQGIRQDEIAEQLNTTQQNVSKWSRQGEQQARDRGLVRDPEQPGKRESVG